MINWFEHCRKFFSRNLSETFVSDIYSLQDNVPFEIRLAETIAWCQPRVNTADPRKSLRNDFLLPNQGASSDKLRLYTKPLERDRLKAIQIVTTVIQQKHLLLQQQAEPIKPSDHLAGGKLLAYFPDEELSDGAAETASHGFFDIYNTPACDTWTGMFEDIRGVYLVAWIPPEFVGLVNDGIAVNPEQCIEWLSDIDVSLSRTLKSKGLLV